MKVLGVIPARYGSTRFPGKPLALIHGKPMIEWVIRGAQESQKLTELIVATDDDRIKNVVEKLNIKVILTPTDIETGTERVWEVVKNLECDIAINIQGDEPLLKGKLLDLLVEPFFENQNLNISTLGKEFTYGDLENPNTAKILLDKNNFAIYFSRFPIPYSRNKDIKVENSLCHIGLYAYRKNFLKTFCEQNVINMERAEGLEQLRALYLGEKIKVVKVDFYSHGVDAPEDIKIIEKHLKRTL